jgi:hypothetical protein
MSNILKQCLTLVNAMSELPVTISGSGVLYQHETQKSYESLEIV